METSYLSDATQGNTLDASALYTHNSEMNYINPSSPEVKASKTSSKTPPRNKIARTLGAIVLGLSSSAMLAPKAEATTGEYVNFQTIVGSGGTSKTLENERTPTWNNLKFRTDYVDASGASDDSVVKDGSIWDAGFFKYVQGGIQFGAYANNNNFWSNRYPDTRAGWLQGLIYADVFPVGTGPDDIIINHNLDGLGGIFRNGTTIDLTNLKPGDTNYYYWDILFGEKQLRGDTTELPKYENTSGNNIILPKMIISPYSEIPSENRGAQALYSEDEREDEAGLPDVLLIAENWLSNDCGPTNYWCDGADWNTDGKVDLNDLAIMSRNYIPE